MPSVSPVSDGYHPRDWRYAWDEFVKLKRAVTKYKVSVIGWDLIAPSKLKKAVDPRWQLRFVNINESHLSNTYLGSDGRTSAESLRQIREVYESYLRHRVTSQDSGSSNSDYDPRFDPKKVREFKDAYTHWPKTKAKEYETSRTKKFMDSRAGVLNMSMREYLFNFWMSNRWPVPPQTKQELDKRIAAQEQLNRDKEQAARDSQRAIGPEIRDTGPGWNA